MSPPCFLTNQLPGFQQLLKVFGRALAPTTLQLLYLPILSPNEDFIFCRRLPETNTIHLIWTWPNFLHNENPKTVIPSVLVASLSIAGPSTYFSLFLFTVSKHPNSNILSCCILTHYLNSMSDDTSQILLPENRHCIV